MNPNYTPVYAPKQSYSNRKGGYFWLLVLLIAFHSLLNIYWIFGLNQARPTWDPAYHTYLSISFLDYFKTHLSSFNLRDFLTISQYYPPFVHLIGAFFKGLLGTDYKAVQLTGTFFLGLSLIFIYKYTLELFKSQRIAFFSAFFFSFFITIYQQSRVHMLDIPVTALTFISLYLLEKSDSFKNKRNVFLFIFFETLAVLSKWYAPVFIFVPLVFKLYEVHMQKRWGELAKAIWPGIIVFLGLTVPWYWLNLTTLQSDLALSVTGELADPQNLYSTTNALFYLKLFIMFQWSFFGFIYLIISTVLVMKKKLTTTHLAILFSALFGYILFTFVSNKDLRYPIPFMPFFAIIMATGLNEIWQKKKYLLGAVAICYTIYLVLSYSILSFGFPIYPKYKHAINFPIMKWTDVYYLHSYPVKVIYEGPKLPYERILSDIYNQKSGRISVLLLGDSPYVNNGIMDPRLYESSVGSRKYDLEYLSYLPLKEKKSLSEMERYLNNEADFILITKSYIGLGPAIREYDDLVRFHDFVLSGKAKKFIPINEYEFGGDDYHPKDKLILLKKI